MNGMIRCIAGVLVVFGTIGRSEIDPSYPTSSIMIGVALGIILGFWGIFSYKQNTI